MRAAVGLLILTLTAACAFGSEEILEVPVWTELDPFVGGEDAPSSETEVHRRMLEDARLVLSGMIYGYRFRYTPSDDARGVPDVFELVLIHEIAWGDPALEVLYVERRDNRAWSKVVYGLADHQQSRRDAWASNTIPAATGRGEAPLHRGRAARGQSLEEAVKQAIRAYARGRIMNKPREIAGEVLLWSAPRTVIGAGSYVTTVQIEVRVEDVVPYRVY